MKVCKNKKCVHGKNPQMESNFYKRTDREGLSDTCKDCDRQTSKERSGRKWESKIGFTNMLIGGQK